MKQLLFVCVTLLLIVLCSCKEFHKLRERHKIRKLSDKDMLYIANLSDSDHLDEVLDNILIPRVVGTPNHEKVYQYIVKEMEALGWAVETDEFRKRTPIFGSLTFKNIVARLNANAQRFLVLACHYDSKYFKNDQFVGATDSAVPCSMLLNLAMVMSNELNLYKNNSDLSLKLIFFDGEEAFEEWGPNDSIYGAKHLVQTFKNNRYLLKTGENVNDLDRIDVLILLDLIGAKFPVFHNSFPKTDKLFSRLMEIEDNLAELNILKQWRRNRRYFREGEANALIEDDHIPFLRHDVSIIHLISYPFPEGWHTPADNRDIIDMRTVENINMILRVFVVEYLNAVLRTSTDDLEIPNKEL